MAKRKVLKITPILILLNIMVIIVIVSFYLFRLIKYYRLEHKPAQSVMLVDKLIQNQSYIDLTNGLILDKDSNSYIFKGKNVNNYVMYSGNLFRIISIDKDKNIKMISDDVMTLMYAGVENGYENSYVNKWLNKSDEEGSGVFEDILYDTENLLTSSSMCEDIISSVDNITCDKINKDNKVVLLSLNDYKLSGGKSSFLNNGKAYYLSDLNDNNKGYYISETGEVGVNEIATKVYGVRPVITVKSSSILLSGEGSEDSPYIIESHDVSYLKDAYVGNIILIDDVKYKIVEKTSDSVKVVLDGILKDKEEENIELVFDSKSNIYDSSSSIYKYLNNDYLKTLNIQKSIKDGKWYTEKLSLDNLDYSFMRKNSTTAKIGMLNLGDFFTSEYKNTYTLTRGIEDDNIINIINDKGNVYGDMISGKHFVRPAFYLDNNLKIVSGVGTYHGPYELGGANE